MISRSRGVVALVLGGAAAVSAARLAAPLGGADAALSVVRLTSTVTVGSADVLRDTHYVWEGPSTSPVIRVVGASLAVLDQLEIEVAPGHHATAAIELADGASGRGPSHTDIRNIRIGTGAPGGFDYGIRWTGVGVSTSNSVTNVSVTGAGIASVSVASAGASANTLRSFASVDAPIGFQSTAGAATTCEACGFTRSTTSDIALSGGSRFDVSGLESVGSRSLASVAAGSAGGGLTIVNGTWEWGSSAVGATITGSNPSALPTWLRLEDFTVKPLDGVVHGSITGFAPAELFLSNVAGIA